MYPVTKWATSSLLKLLVACMCMTGWDNWLIGSISSTGYLTNTASVSRRVTVREGETAYRIARRYKSDSVTMDQMLLALLRENSAVFQAGNLHRIRAGSVLVIPSHPVVEKTSPTEASQVVQGQNRRIISENSWIASQAATAASVQPRVPQPLPLPGATSSQNLATTVSRGGEIMLAPVLPNSEQNTIKDASKTVQGRFSINVWIGLLLMGAVILLSLNRKRMRDRFRGWRRRSVIDNSTSVSASVSAVRRSQTVLEMMVSIRDLNRRMRLEIEVWIRSQNIAPTAVRPSVTNWKPSILVIPESGFQKIAQSDFFLFQKDNSASCFAENHIDGRFLGHGLDLDFKFITNKSKYSVLDKQSFKSQTVGGSEIPSHIQSPSCPQTPFQRTKSMKASGFSFSPSEYLANQQIQMLSLEEEGIYIRLLSYCWQNGSVPRDPEQAARLVGKGALTTVVASVLRLFHATSNPQELTHLDLLQQKERLTQWKEKSAAGGRKSAAVRKGGSTILAAVREKNQETIIYNNQNSSTPSSLPRDLASSQPRLFASEPPEIDSKASQEAFERQAIAMGLLATDGAFLHRQWRSKDPELRAGMTADWQQWMLAWKEQGRFPSQFTNPGGGRVPEKARPAPAAIIPPQASRDFPKFAASNTPYTFRFDGVQTSNGS